MANFQTLTADGASDAKLLSGEVLVILKGTFGSGTAQIQVAANDDDWVDLTGGSFTAAVAQIMNFPQKTKVKTRVNLSSSTSPNLYVELRD